MRTSYPKPQPAALATSRAFLARLVAGGALTPFQVDWIGTIWLNLDADAFAHPYLQTVREHTRAYLERAS